MRSTLRIPSNSLVDIAKYVAEVQELSKNIMKELDANKNEKELSDAKNHLTNNQLDQSDNMSQSHLLLQKPILDSETKDTLDLYTENCSVENKDSSFDNVLQSFINEEDEWLSQAISSQEAIKPVPKISFVKCKSENELLLGQPKGTDVKNKFANKIKNNFQRTSSFDIKRSITNLNNNALTKISSSQIKSSTGTKEVVSKAPTVQYSQQEIEKKRLEAIYRRERKEIERKKMEALKRLEMKKMRAIKT